MVEVVSCVHCALVSHPVSLSVAPGTTVISDDLPKLARYPLIMPACISSAAVNVFVTPAGVNCASPPPVLMTFVIDAPIGGIASVSPASTHTVISVPLVVTPVVAYAPPHAVANSRIARVCTFIFIFSVSFILGLGFIHSAWAYSPLRRIV